MVFVLNQNGEPLMPCNERKARILLKSGKAKIVGYQPFTIQLLHGSSGYKQPINLGIDSGYTYIGFSAVSAKKELMGGELTLLFGMSELLNERRSYRRTRRNRLRYRKPGFLKDTKGKDWLAPSIRHKRDSHVKLVNTIKKVLPVSKIIVEIANFDIQKIKNPDIAGKSYQEGEQKGFSDLREYILHRDHHRCQNPECQQKSKILEVHHLGFWKHDRTDRPDNLITLCTRCHSAKNHQKSGFLYGWEPKLKGFREATFMTMVRKKLVDQLHCQTTYGVMTKFKRHELKLDKSHHNDAFVIAEGTDQTRAKPTHIQQKRKNNRCLEKFFDAKYLDLRDGEEKTGKELCSQRRKRNRENLPESLRKYRAKKRQQGGRRIRKQRYAIRPMDIVLYQGKQYSAIGVQNHGNYLKMTDGLQSVVKPIKDIKCLYHQKTFVWR